MRNGFRLPNLVLHPVSVHQAISGSVTTSNERASAMKNAMKLTLAPTLR